MLQFLGHGRLLQRTSGLTAPTHTHRSSDDPKESTMDLAYRHAIAHQAQLLAAAEHHRAVAAHRTPRSRSLAARTRQGLSLAADRARRAAAGSDATEVCATC